MSIYTAHRRNNASNALDVPSSVQKETSSMYDKKTVNLHVRVTQVVSEQVPCRWFSDSEGATAVRIELKPWNNEKMAAGGAKMLSFSNLERPVYTALTDNQKSYANHNHKQRCTHYRATL